MEFARLQVKVLPHGKKLEVVSYRDGILTVRVQAPAERGKANSELIHFLKKLLRVSPEILHGEFSPRKVLRIPGITLKEALRRLNVTCEEEGLSSPADIRRDKDGGGL